MFNNINSDTEQMQKKEFYMDNDLHFKVEVVRSMFDGKMEAVFLGAGGVCCQLCTATFNRLDNTNL